MSDGNRFAQAVHDGLSVAGYNNCRQIVRDEGAFSRYCSFVYSALASLTTAPQIASAMGEGGTGCGGGFASLVNLFVNRKKPLLAAA